MFSRDTFFRGKPSELCAGFINTYLLSLNTLFRGAIRPTEVILATIEPSSDASRHVHGRLSFWRLESACRRDVTSELRRLVSARRLVDVAGKAMCWRTALEIGRMESNPAGMFSVCVVIITYYGVAYIELSVPSNQ